VLLEQERPEPLQADHLFESTLQLAVQARVVEADRRLIGERRQQLDLAGVKGVRGCVYADKVPRVRLRARSGSTSRLRASVRSAAVRASSRSDTSPNGARRICGRPVETAAPGQGSLYGDAHGAELERVLAHGDLHFQLAPPARSSSIDTVAAPESDSACWAITRKARSGRSSSASALLAACRPVTSASLSRTSHTAGRSRSRWPGGWPAVP